MIIRDARAAELQVLRDIDVATGQMFRDIGMPEIAEYDPWPLPDLEHARAAGLLWVIPGKAGQPVAFLIRSMVDGCLHIDQLSVDPGSARRGLIPSPGCRGPGYRGACTPVATGPGPSRPPAA